MKKIISILSTIPVEGVLSGFLSGILVAWVAPLPSWLYNSLPANTWETLSSPRFSILQSTIFVLTFSFVASIASYLSPRMKNKRLKQMLPTKWEMGSQQCTVTWKIYMDDDTPLPYDITVFCHQHGDIPLKMPGGRCTIDDCQYSVRPMSMDKISNFIESVLSDELEKLKGQPKK